jgi:hypothetical protein
MRAGPNVQRAFTIVPIRILRGDSSRHIDDAARIWYLYEGPPLLRELVNSELLKNSRCIAPTAGARMDECALPFHARIKYGAPNHEKRSVP